MIAVAFGDLEAATPLWRRMMQNRRKAKSPLLLGAIFASLPGLAFATEPASPLAGPYMSIGVFAGGNFSQQTVSLRLPNGQQRTLSTELVTPTTNVGVRLGYGKVIFENIYLGAEAEGSLPFRASTEQYALGVRYITKTEAEGAGFVRLGWTPDGQSMVFVRAGALNLNRSVEVPQYNYRTKSDGGWAPAFGVGLEVGLSQNASVRLDMSHANTSGDSNLKTFQGSIGISYRF